MRGTGYHTCGSGSAGGYGYHRASAAAGEAITNAGFKLSESINGAGDTAIEDALCAIAQIQGYRKAILVESHA